MRFDIFIFVLNLTLFVSLLVSFVNPFTADLVKALYFAILV